MLTVFFLVICFVHTSLQAANAQSSKYIVCRPGTLNIIIAAPHGGSMNPASIPDRDAGCWNSSIGGCVYRHSCQQKDHKKCSVVTVNDVKTSELTEQIADEMDRLYGARPTIVLNQLRRTKLDANRDLDQASFREPAAVQAWHEFHHCIDAAKAKIEGQGNMGLFIDIHGHGHPRQWAELGYLIKKADLNSGVSINSAITSIRNLAGYISSDFDQLLRGSLSFGYYLEKEGYDAVPSPNNRVPGENKYFSGGYNTRRHGSREKGAVDAIQIESARTPRENWNSYGRALAKALMNYYTDNYQDQTGSAGAIRFSMILILLLAFLLTIELHFP